MFGLSRIVEIIRAAGGRPLLVGGAVRDGLLGLEPKDLDIEVYGIAPEEIEAALRRHYDVDAVGRAFGVLKVRVPGIPEPVDVSLPRRENKNGLGHKGFEVLSDPALSPCEAARRRDLTINALAAEPISGDILDFFGGVADLEARILRATDPQRFVEDPLRVLRVAQFAARLEFEPTSELVELCRGLDVAELPCERVGEEWEKLLVKGQRPSRGLRFLDQCGQLGHVPELEALVAIPQDPEWHPEGHVFAHACHVLDAAVGIAERNRLSGEDRLAVMAAALCHDLGKAVTSVQCADGRWRSPGHAEAGVPLAESLLSRLCMARRIVARVLPLVREHMAHLGMPAAPKALRRLARRLAPATVAEWGRVIEADHSGRPPLEQGNPVTAHVAVAAELAVAQAAPRPVLMGRHLVAVGLEPGPQFGSLLARAYEAQLDGLVTDPKEALALLGLGR